MFHQLTLSVVAIAFLSACPTTTLAQRHRWHNEAFAFRRTIDIPEGMQSQPEIIIAEFFTHGSWDGEANPGEAIVYSADRDPVASRVMQLGPGDFARIAFRPTKDRSRYYVYYGGRPAGAIEVPRWTPTSGLLMETRRWRPVDFNSLDSVREVFAASESLGSDYVGGVFHRHNPFSPEPGPFLSRYIGLLNAPTAGTYTFYTSSQDCSFLLVAGEQVVAAPGVHEPDPRGETTGTIKLEPGAHTFEYYHAAGGTQCCMVAAWTLPGGDGPVRISPDVFRYDRVLRIPPTQLEHRDRGYLPDFRMAVLDDIPSAELDQPAMVRVQFVDATAELAAKGANHVWSFGDGQASEYPNPGHVFLQPGEYPVRLSLRRRGKDTSVTNRIYVTRQFILDAKGQEGEDLETYIETLKNYNSVNLSAAGLVQLVRAYLSADDPVSATDAAVTAFFRPDDDAGHTDITRWALATLAGPVLRNQLDNPATAARLWTAARRQITDRGLRAAAAVEAADILLNDLLLPADAKESLDFAEQYVGLVKPVMASKYYRVLGDWQARGGNSADARSSYIRSSVRRQLEATAAEMAARRGAYAQSIEALLRSRELVRAREELDDWLGDFPRDKTEGFYSFLQMQYWVYREKFPQALAQASDLMVVNPRSVYADRVLFLSAKCHEESKQIPRAIATLRSLLAEHPGSPLVEPAKRYIERLSAAAAQNQP